METSLQTDERSPMEEEDKWEFCGEEILEPIIEQDAFAGEEEMQIVCFRVAQCEKGYNYYLEYLFLRTLPVEKKFVFPTIAAKSALDIATAIKHKEDEMDILGVSESVATKQKYLVVQSKKSSSFGQDADFVALTVDEIVNKQQCMSHIVDWFIENAPYMTHLRNPVTLEAIEIPQVIWLETDAFRDENGKYGYFYYFYGDAFATEKMDLVKRFIFFPDSKRIVYNCGTEKGHEFDDAAIVYFIYKDRPIWCIKSVQDFSAI